MRGDDRAVGRTIAVIVLMTLATVALRGYLPGAERRIEPDEISSGSGSIAAVVVMLVVSIAVIAVSILSQALQRTAGPGPTEQHRDARGSRGRVRWKPLLVATIVLLAWSLVLLALMQWVSPPALDDAAPTSPGAPTPRPPAGADEPRGPRPAEGGGSVFAILAGATIVLVVVSIAGTVLRRRRPPAPPMPVETGAPVATRAEAPDLARAAELGLAEMDDPSRSPREAIIACYLAMERELEKSPGTTPRASDTPSEVLGRAIEMHALQAGSATDLVDLFEEARFSPHVMSESHRIDAVRALQSVLHELQVSS